MVQKTRAVTMYPTLLLSFAVSGYLSSITIPCQPPQTSHDSASTSINFFIYSMYLFLDAVSSNPSEVVHLPGGVPPGVHIAVKPFALNQKHIVVNEFPGIPGAVAVYCCCCASASKRARKLPSLSLLLPRPPLSASPLLRLCLFLFHPP